MTSIRSFAEILRDDKNIDDAQLSHFSSIIHDESIRLTYLLDEILDLSFLEHGRVQLNVKKVSLGSIIERAKNSTQTIRQQSNTVIKIEPQFLMLELETDADRLSQVFINLISNAIKHSGQAQPEIRFNCKVQEHSLLIEVADNGSGISSENAELIFQKFAKLSTEQSAGSAGLGLPISREIVRNLGGKLLYVGNNPGAVFHIILPKTTSDSTLGTDAIEVAE
jgi:signal transduction histidine kinase